MAVAAPSRRAGAACGSCDPVSLGCPLPRAARHPTAEAPTTTTPEPLAPTPTASAWGRKAATTYLGIVAVGAALMVRELIAGASGVGTMAVSILTAPWSVLLASVARAVAPSLPPAAMRTSGLVLVVLAALLNARIVYGIAARAERDARPRPAPGGDSHG